MAALYSAPAVDETHQALKLYQFFQPHRLLVCPRKWWEVGHIQKYAPHRCFSNFRSVVGWVRVPGDLWVCMNLCT